MNLTTAFLKEVMRKENITGGIFNRLVLFDHKIGNFQLYKGEYS